LKPPQRPSTDTLPVLVPLQTPKPVWQPAPQWSVVPPQYPLAEQQSPKPEPVHILPLVPHLPSLDTLAELVEHVPNPDWQPDPQCAESVPQNPLEEQQSPKVEPVQIMPLALAPHCPLVDTFPDVPPPPPPLPPPVPGEEQVPNASRHPEPQWSDVLPQ
jgi:hypothetical protein